MSFTFTPYRMTVWIDGSFWDALEELVAGCRFMDVAPVGSLSYRWVDDRPMLTLDFTESVPVAVAV